MKKRMMLMTVLASSLVVGGCCKAIPGAMSGRWVVVMHGQSSAGVANGPHEGAPLEVGATADVTSGCFSSETLDHHFGAQCLVHETEGGASPVMTDEVLPGTNPTKSEVRWYCDRQNTIRLVLQRCNATNTFQVTEIAVARKGE